MTTPRRLTEGAQLTAGAVAYYTCPINTRCIIKKLTFANPTVNARLVTVYLVPSGGTATATSTLRPPRAVGPNDTWECFEAENHILEQGDSIQALADAITAITIMASGIEIV